MTILGINKSKINFRLFIAAVSFALISFANSTYAQIRDWSELLEKVLPGTVNIHVIKEGIVQPAIPGIWEDFFGMQPQGIQRVGSIGSGFFISREGFLVTNYHVVEDAVEVKVINQKGEEVDATVIGTHKDSDLAVLKIEKVENFKFSPLAWGNSDGVKIGSPVLAIGNPYDLRGTVTAGIVSARGRNIGIGKYDNFIQTDATIGQGNSGGPLINADGEVIGINTVMVTSAEGGGAGLALAIPSNWARTIVNQILEYGEARIGGIGVSLEALTEQLKELLELPTSGGALVSSVIENSPAKRGGIAQGDVIVEFNGNEIKNGRDLILAVTQVPVGTVVDVRVWRFKENRGYAFMGNKGDYVDLRVEVGLRDSVLGSKDVLVQQIGAKIGQVSDLSKEQVEDFGIPSNIKEGVVITEVKRNSSAQKAGLLPGDVLLVLSGIEITIIDQVIDMLSDVPEEGWKALVWYNRAGRVQYAIISTLDEKKKNDK